MSKITINFKIPHIFDANFVDFFSEINLVIRDFENPLCRDFTVFGYIGN
jgi:hypothetical protein